MPFIGNQLSTSFQNVETQTITGDGSTSYTLNNAVADGKDLLVYINNVKQEEGSGKSYTATGTTITFSDAVASTDSCYVVFIGQAVGTVTPKDGSIVSSMLADANLEMPNTLDLNGKELILDADADTSITADTDDQIDIKIAGTDTVHITSSGVGIGTSSITNVLHVHQSDASANSYVHITQEDGGSSATDGLSIGIEDGGVNAVIRNRENGYLRMFTNNTERMRIDSSGNVGIGTTSSFGKLNVNVTAGAPASSGNMTNGLTVHNTDGGRAIQLGVDESGGYTYLQSAYVNNAGVAQNMAFFTGSTERMRIDSSGAMILGRTDAFTSGGGNTGGDGGLHIARSSERCLFLLRSGSNGEVVNFIRGGITNPVGTISIDTSSTAYNTSSDYRLKENIVTDWDATSRLKQLKPSRFNFKVDKDKTVDGFIAHEVSSIVPEAITGEKDAVDKDGNIQPQGIDHSKLVPLMVKTIQELEERIAKLESK